MAKVGIREAAKLVGKSYRTLYRHIQQGRVTVEHDHDGVIKVDTSELIRVYGEISQPGTDVSQVSQSDVTEASHPTALLQAIESLTAEIQELRQVTESQGELIKTLTNRLEHIPDPEATEPPEEKNTSPERELSEPFVVKDDHSEPQQEEPAQPIQDIGDLLKKHFS